MTRRQHLLAALFFFFLAGVVQAQESPSFLVERIDVRGARFASESVVVRESLLVPGRVYTEPQLRDALSRINRLPFVLDSTFAVEKGSERGAYVLVVTIVETKPLFVEAQSLFQTSPGNDVMNDETIRSGARWFFGSSTLVHASTDFDGNYEAGVTQYNLFGRPGYVTLNVRWRPDASSSGPTPDGEGHYESEVDPSPELLVGFPVAGNHSVQGRFTYGASRFHRETDVVLDDWTQTNQTLALAWVWDTTDDPILPTRGSLWRTEGGLERSNANVKAQSQFTLAPDTDTQRISTTLLHYHPVNDRLSVMIGGGVGVSRSEFSDAVPPVIIPEPSLTTWSVYPQVGTTVSLWPDRLTRKFGDLRWESRAVYTKLTTSSDFGSFDYLIASTALVQRNVWGTLRLSFYYSRSFSELD